MGFDIECIIDIQTYPGEYFCPVCRTLVYPNEAFQSQCSHLYCKPCLAHIANGSKACPYDGYLVTESDSKPLIDSDKSLVEKIGQVKVHCLYFRSGCTWEGILSDCNSHCSECSFGNSPVICNRCGIQIVHRQVHDHAQSCPGVYESQPGIGGVSGANGSGTVSSATANTNQSVAQSGPPLPQSQNPPNASVALQAGKNPNQQPIANTQAPLVASVPVPTPEQWYQQQYQQYYQQFTGYDPYQQPHQQYYSLQQQPLQQNQQHALHMQGQPQSQVYTQPQPPPQHQPLASLPAPPQHQPLAPLPTPPLPQPQPLAQLPAQPQPQLPAQPQPQLQLQPQPLAPFSAQPQPKSQPPFQLQAQSQSYPVPQIQQMPHFQPLAQGQAQSQPQLLPQAMSQVQVPPQGQPQLRPPIQASAPNYQVNPQQHTPLMRPQAQVPPQILPPPPNSQPTQPPPAAQTVGMQPAAQHPQMPQFQQPPLQMHHLHTSQSHIQPQIHPQPQFQNQSSNQSNLPSQPQAPQYHNQFPQVRPPPSNMMPTVPSVLPQPPHLPASSVSGHHSYQQHQPGQQMQSGAPQQNPIHQHPSSASFHPLKVHSQVPQPPAVMRPPPSHGSLPQQLSTFLPPQSEVSGIPPYQQFSAHAQPPSHPPQHGTVMHPVQQAPSQQFSQQQPFLAPVKGQTHQQSHFPQQPLQPQFRPYGPPQSQQPQNFVGRNIMSDEGMLPQTYSHASGGFGAMTHAGPAQPGSNLTSVNQNPVKSTVLEKEDSLSNKHPTVPDSVLPEQGHVEKDVHGTDVEPLKEETILNKKMGPHRTASKDIIKDEATVGALSSETSTAEANVCKEESHSGIGSNSLKQVEDHESQKAAVVAGPSTADFEKVPHTTASVPEVQVREHPPPVPRPQGSGILPHPAQSLPLPAPSTHIGRAPGYFGPPPRSFESLPASQGLGPTTDTHGIMGKAPQPRHDGQFGLQNSVRPSEVAALKEQRSGSSHLSGSGEGFPPRQAYGNEATYWRSNGETEHLNPITMEPTWPLDQASRSLDKTLPGSSYDAGMKLNSGALDQQSRFFPPHHPSVGHDHGDGFGPGHEFGRRQMKHFSSRSPDGDYLGISPREFGGLSGFPRGTSGFEDINARESHRFGEGSRSFNLPSDPVGNPFRDSRFPPLSGHQRRGDIDGPSNLRFGENAPRDGLHNHMRTDEAFGQQGPGPLMRGEFSGPGYLPGHFMSETAGPGTFPGHSHVGEFAGPGNFPHHLPFGESIRAERPSIPFGEPGIRNSYSHQGFPITGNFVGEVDSFDQLRKRNPISMGWCRICKFDCDTVEGLEMHSQTREHQKMAMAMVKTIKQRSKKKQRTSAGHMAHEVGTSSRKVVSNGRGNKH